MSLLIGMLRRFRASTLGRRAAASSSAFQVIGWWEARRIPFNLGLGVAGLCTLTVIGLGAAGFAFDHGTSRGSLALFLSFFTGAIDASIVAYFIKANVCYTGGWVAELVVRRTWPEHSAHFGELTFTLGFFFAIFLTLLPAPMNALLMTWTLLAVHR